MPIIVLAMVREVRRILATAAGGLVLVTLLSSIASPAVSAQENPRTLSSAERAGGWRMLFDGKSLDAFRGFKKEAAPTSGWKIDDGRLHVVAGANGGDIITKERFENFELTFEFEVGAKGNSGVMYRVTEDSETTWLTGPEYQVLDDRGHGLAANDPHSTGALYDIASPPEDKIVVEPGQRHVGRIRLKDDLVEHWLDGKLVLRRSLAGEEWEKSVASSKFKDAKGFGRSKRGHLAFQDHGTDVWYWNVRVRDLDAPLPGEVVLFNGKDLTGWTSFLLDDGKMQDTWSVQDGILVCLGKPIGYIRTSADHLNFVLKLEWRFNPVTKKEGNSGVLLRMIGDDKVWPKSVEAQLQSRAAGDFWNIDDFEMTTAADRRNGRNTRRTHDAELPVGEWNEYEIIVDHDRVTLRVNGQVLNEATAVAEIPGKICLQSEGAEIHFRRIRLSPIE